MFGALTTLVGRSFGELQEGTPSGTGLLAAAQQDTLSFLDEWGETLTIKRRVNTYGGPTGKAVVTWVEIGDFTGDWQALPGSAVIEEEGLKVKSSSQIIAAYDVDVRAGDRIYKAGGTYEYVNYPRKYEDHITIRMKFTEGE